MTLDKKLLATVFILTVQLIRAQSPAPALIGYWQNWQDANSPYIQLDQVDSRYNIINVSFAVPKTGTDYDMEFIPDNASQTELITQIQALQSQEKKVLISAGGATAPVKLDNTTERDAFISSMSAIINTYGFDGLDIDFEGSSLSVSGGTIAAPTDAPVIHLIYALKKIMADYRAQHNKKLLLTMAPETAFVQGGQSAYSGIWGAYLPVIQALKDSMELLHVQLYNSGSMYGIDGKIYTSGTADFIVAMTEAVIKGFTTAGGKFDGLPETKVAIGLPACTGAAGSGFTDTSKVRAAVNYLRGKGSPPGTYKLVNVSGYPHLRGMMTWSVNWDAVSTCGSVYEYAANFEKLFGTVTAVDPDAMYTSAVKIGTDADGSLTVELPGALERTEHISIYNSMGQLVYSGEPVQKRFTVDASSFASGLYVIRLGNSVHKWIRSH